MTSMTFQRARRPEQKAQRRAAILGAAAELVAEKGAVGVSLKDIASRVGLAKSNVYRYFESREQIFLSLLLEDLVDWGEEVEGRLEAEAGRNGAAAAARIMSRAFGARPRLCELYGVLSWVLDQQVSAATRGEFRAAADRGAARVAGALHVALPSIPEAQCRWVLQAILAQVAGRWPLTERVPFMAPVLPRPGGTEGGSGFEGDLERCVRALLYGLLMEAWRASGQPVDRG